MKNDRYLTFALGKGRLANKTLELFEQIGITCEEMKDKSSRKLIFVNEALKLRFFLAKGPDVPTYVEYGAADIGVVGRDTILEENRNVYEVLDLGFGKCRMCVCGPREAGELLQHHERIRVASKYPNIAREYFYNKTSDCGYHQAEWFRGAGTSGGVVGCDCGHRGDRRDTPGKRPGSAGGNMSFIRPDDCKPGEHADGDRTHQRIDSPPAGPTAVI